MSHESMYRLREEFDKCPTVCTGRCCFLGFQSNKLQLSTDLDAFSFSIPLQEVDFLGSVMFTLFLPSVLDLMGAAMFDP